MPSAWQIHHREVNTPRPWLLATRKQLSPRKFAQAKQVEGRLEGLQVTSHGEGKH
jgi:hypothetical protein